MLTILEASCIWKSYELSFTKDNLIILYKDDVEYIVYIKRKYIKGG